MNVILNLHYEHSLNYIYYKPERIVSGLKDRAEAIKSYLGGKIHAKINSRGTTEQSYAYNGNTDAKKRLCKGTFHKGCKLFTKYQ